MRLGRELNEGYGLSSVPYFFKDNASGQTFAQAYDAVAGQLRGGTAAADVSPATVVRERRRAGQTAALASALSGDFIEGNLSNIWLVLNNTRVAARAAVAEQPADSDAVDARRRRRFVLQRAVRQPAEAHGQRAHVLGELHAVGGARPDRRRAEYVHVALDGVRSGRRLRSGAIRSPARAELEFRLRPAVRTRRLGLKRALLGDWYVAGIVTATSGVPLDVCQRAGVFGGGIQFVTCSGAILTGGDVSVGVNEGVTGSGGVGTSGNPATGGTGREHVRRSRTGLPRASGRSASARIRAPVAARSMVSRAGTWTCRSASRSPSSRNVRGRGHGRHPQPVQHHSVQQPRAEPDARRRPSAWSRRRATSRAQSRSGCGWSFEYGAGPGDVCDHSMDSARGPGGGHWRAAGRARAAGQAHAGDDERRGERLATRVSRRDGASHPVHLEQVGTSKMWIMAADGTDPRPLIQDEGAESSPSWSPDGRRISFTRTDAGQPDIWVVEADGSGAAPASPTTRRTSALPPGRRTGADCVHVRPRRIARTSGSWPSSGGAAEQLTEKTNAA